MGACFCSNVIKLTNSLDTEVIVQLTIRILTTDQIITSDKANFKLNGKLQAEGQIRHKQTKTEKVQQSRIPILKKGLFQRKIQNNESIHLVLKTIKNKVQQQFHDQLLNKRENCSYCIWQPNEANTPVLIPTHWNDNWRFLLKDAQTYNQNYPDGKFCRKCLQTKGCKQDCLNLKQFGGLTISQVQRIFQRQKQLQQSKLKMLLFQTTAGTIMKNSSVNYLMKQSIRLSKFNSCNTSKRQSYTEISRLISISSPKQQQQIQMSIQNTFKQQQCKYVFEIDRTHPHIELKAFQFKKNLIIKNKKDMPGWIGGILVATKPFPQKNWHQIKLWVNSESSRISLGLVNQQSKNWMNFKNDQFLYYNGNAWGQGREAIVFQQKAAYGQEKFPGGIITLVLRVNIQRGQASFIYYDKENKNQKQRRLIKIPDTVLGTNKKVYPYVGISLPNDSIMFL